MATRISTEFYMIKKRPLDIRCYYTNLNEMKTTRETYLYSGVMAWVETEKQFYVYNSDNTVDPVTGRWRVFEAGGASGLKIGYYNLTNDKFYEEASCTTEIEDDAETLYWDIATNASGVAHNILYRCDIAAVAPNKKYVPVNVPAATNAEVSSAASAVFN